MPLTDARCTNCGGRLVVDDSKDAAICPYCKTAYVVRDAINYYNSYTTNNYSVDKLYADTVNINNTRSADERLGAAEQYMKFRDFQHAAEIFREVCESDPQDPRCWMGLARARSQELNAETGGGWRDTVDLAREVCGYLDRAMMTGPGDRDTASSAASYKEAVRRRLSEIKRQKEQQLQAINDEILREQSAALSRMGALPDRGRDPAQVRKEAERLRRWTENINPWYYPAGFFALGFLASFSDRDPTTHNISGLLALGFLIIGILVRNSKTVSLRSKEEYLKEESNRSSAGYTRSGERQMLERELREMEDTDISFLNR